MDRRTWLALVLCFLIYLGWQKMYLEPRAPKSAPAATASAAATTVAKTSEPVGTQPATPQQTTKAALETRDLPISGGKLTVSNENRLISGWELSNYRWGAEGLPVPLSAITHRESELELAFESPEFAYLAQTRGTIESIEGGVRTTYSDAKIRVVREVRTSPGRGDIDVSIRATFLGDAPAPKFAFISLEGASSKADPEQHDRHWIHWSGEKAHSSAFEEAGTQQQLVGPVRWVANVNRYFIFAVTQAQDPLAATSGLIQPLGPWTSRMSLVYPIPSGAREITIPLKAFFGPREAAALRAVDPTLDAAIDFGFFRIVALPLLWLLKYFHALFGNWGTAIILLTLLVRVITIPLNWKGMKNMKKMAKFQPQMKALQEKHKDDRQAYQQEMMLFMRSNGVNPLAGCFPILIQMPVFFALYRVLYSSVELYQAPFALWIHDLSLKDPYYVTPVLLTGVMWLQQKLTPNTATDPMQAKMLQWMPLIFGVFMVSVPAGLTLYMLVNAISGIAQQLVFNRLLKNA